MNETQARPVGEVKDPKSGLVGKPSALDAVLIAEDDPIFRRILESWFKRWDYCVTAVENGLDAWEILKKEDAPQLAILDWMMPGMDGSPQVAFDALASLAWGESKEDLLEGAEMAADGALLNISFDWRKKGNAMHKTWDNTILGHMKIAGRTLTVEVNSAQRAGRIHAEIDRRLGILARHQGTVSQTPEQLLATKKQSKQFLPSLAKPDRDDSNIESETLETVRASMRQEMEDWVDLKLPVLGGRTPRQAVQEPDGREIVEGILLEWERSAAQPSVAKFINPDVSIIRRLLHLQG